MKTYINVWQKSIAITASLSLSLLALPNPSNAAPETTSVRNQSEYQLAQIGTCRQIEANEGVNIRESPSNDSRVITVLTDEQTVNILNRGSNGWVQIEAPVAGYIESRFLTACTGAIPSAGDSSCRKVESSGGLNVREKPSVDSRAIARLTDEQIIKIANPGSNGWVPITSPYQGYVASNYLTYCSIGQEQALQ